MKYKVGDKVRVKQDLKVGELVTPNRRSFINSRMTGYCGEVVTITRVREEDYEIEEDEGTCWWNDEMLEDVVVKNFAVGDLVKIVRIIGDAAKENHLGKTYAIIRDWGTGEYDYGLDGSGGWLFDTEELELVSSTKEPVESPVEELKNTDNSWFGKKYKINYLKGISYRDVFDQGGKVSTITGKLINIDTPFTGRFFLENDNGALEIILMETVVEMREVV